jgi:hypothetical protein
MQYLALLSIPIIIAYIWIRILRPRIIKPNIIEQHIPVQTPYYFLVTAEQGTIPHTIATEDTILEYVDNNPTTGIDTFYATLEDMIEHDARLAYNAREIKAEERKRLGYTTKKGKKR